MKRPKLFGQLNRKRREAQPDVAGERARRAATRGPVPPKAPRRRRPPKVG